MGLVTCLCICTSLTCDVHCFLCVCLGFSMYWAHAKRKVCIAGGVTLLKTLIRLIWAYVKEPTYISWAVNPAVSITKSHEPPSRPPKGSEPRSPRLVLGLIYRDCAVYWLSRPT